MTNEELVQKIKQGEDVQSNKLLLFEQNRGLIYKTIKPLSAICEIEDLLQESWFGLEQAIEKYNPERGQFTTCLVWGVKNVCNLYCQTGRNIRLPVGVGQMVSKYVKFCNQFHEDNGRPPEKDDVIEGLGIAPETFNSLMDALNSTSMDSFSRVLNEHAETLEDIIPSGQDMEQEIVDRLSEEELSTTIQECLEMLSPKLHECIQDRYWNNMKQEDIAIKKNVSRQAVSQWEKDALKKLKGMKKIRRLGLEFDYDCKLSYRMSMKRCVDEHTSPTEVIALKHVQLQEQAEKCLKEVQFMQKVQEVNTKKKKMKKKDFRFDWNDMVEQAEDLFSQIVNG